jgi:2-polyprenyl-6-methoxyphenol hydroxylase-like FAD-dependent oxidoreductase
MPRMNVKTVLISGLGIGGPTLAFWLRAAGFEPTLIERAPGLRAGGFVIDFWGLGYDLAERRELTGGRYFLFVRLDRQRAWLGLGQQCSAWSVEKRMYYLDTKSVRIR